MTTTTLDERLVRVFGEVFGAHYCGQLVPETSMDDILEWDSTSFLDLVLSLENEYGVEFTPDESAQMFQLGHIQRIIDGAVLDIPNDDVANACCLLHQVRNTTSEQLNMLLISGSSTREGLLRPAEAESILRNAAGGDANWFNISVSGLVVAETLQLLEVAGSEWRGIVVFGTSPVILGGCGEAEFIRSATHARFPFRSAKMEEILARHGYTARPEEDPMLMSLELWFERYMKGHDPSELRYEPYIYPTLAPWPLEKYDSREDFLRFYNQSVLNHEQSCSINAELYEEIADWCAGLDLPLVLVELTLHSKSCEHLNRIGGIVSKYRDFIEDFTRRRGIPYIDAPAIAGIGDDDFRDPAHVYRKREEYTGAVIHGVLMAIGSARGRT